MLRRWFRPRPVRRLRRWLRRNRWWVLVALVALWWADSQGLVPPLPRVELPSWGPGTATESDTDFDTEHYDRKQWRHWSDVDGNCRNTRHEVLVAESEVPVTFATGDRCKVRRGRWRCPFTGRVFTDPSKLDVDHMVPLHEAHRSGGSAWSAERKERYANELSDPGHLVAVDRAANRSKGDKGPDAWLPSDRGARCDYIREWTRIKARWSLRMDAAEQRAVEAMLGTCDAGRVPNRF